MVFLGSDRSEAINKIQASNEKRESPVSVIKSAKWLCDISVSI